MKQKKSIVNMNKTIIYTILIIFILGCDNSRNKSQLPIKPLSGVILEKNRKDIYKQDFKLADSSKLFGKWNLIKEWGYFENSWAAIGPVEIKKQYHFTQNSKFHQTDFDRNGNIRNTIRGEFYLDSTRKKIIFLFNDYNDTIIQIGDTIKAFEHKLHLLNDTTMRIEEFSSYASENHLNIGEYEKIE